MNQRSLLSSGQWRRAVHLTLVSLVQTKYSPSGDTLFLPGSLTTGRRTHHPDSTHEKEAYAQTQATTEEETVTQCAFCLCVYRCACTHRLTYFCVGVQYVCVCVHDIKKFRSWMLTFQTQYKYSCYVSLSWPLSLSCIPKYLLEDPGTCNLTFWLTL